MGRSTRNRRNIRTRESRRNQGQEQVSMSRRIRNIMGSSVAGVGIGTSVGTETEAGAAGAGAGSGIGTGVEAGVKGSDAAKHWHQE